MLLHDQTCSFRLQIWWRHNQLSRMRHKNYDDKQLYENLAVGFYIEQNSLMIARGKEILEGLESAPLFW